MTPFLFGVHCHQPVDNFSFVVDEAIEKSYKPFFQTLVNYPKIKVNVHFSGWLLEYIQHNDQTLFKLLQGLSSQIEFFSGGFYEPILLSIDSCHRVAQIKKLNSYIKKHFNQTPKGLWLTERVWDNVLIDDIKECGIEYVVVDDHHFYNSFYNDLNGYYLTQNGSKTLGLFAISQKLRYAIPFTKEQEVLQTITQNKDLNVIFDDGEKFGVWPGTYERVYEKGWLQNFFSLLSSDKRVKPQTFYEYYTQNPPLGLAYLAPTSYKEMGLWSLDHDKAARYKALCRQGIDQDFLKGGLWQNFFKKYQESNWLHKRMGQLAKEKNPQKKFLNNLFKAQCNDVFWHGVFGGIYLPNLRDNAYRYLIRCHKALKKPRAQDLDMDGAKEYALQTPQLLLFFHSQGGQIYEFDLFDKEFNLQNTMTRYKEHYHDDIEVGKKEDESTIHKEKLYVEQKPDFFYDWYLKKSGIDHFSDTTFTVQNFENGSFKEYGDFANQPFDTLKSKNTLHFYRKGGIYKEKKYDCFVQKSYKLSQNRLCTKVRFTTEYDKVLRYVHEYNLHFFDYEKLFINGTALGQTMHIFSNTLTITDTLLEKSFCFAFEKSIDIYIAKIKTVTQSEKGVDETIQGISVGFMQEFVKEGVFNLSFTVSSL